MFQQAAATLFFGLGVPLLFAFFWWLKRPQLKFPKRFSSLLAILSFSAGLLGPALFLNLVAKGINVAGDNPGAIGGIVFGLLLLVPSYWVSMGSLFWIMRRWQTRAAKPLP